MIVFSLFLVSAPARPSGQWSVIKMRSNRCAVS
jgi:hypothetical protein